MDQGLYDVVFNGTLATGFESGQVIQNIAALFKVDVSKIEPLFSGKLVVVKGGIDKQTAMKYQAAMKKAGAICVLRASQPQGEQDKPARTPSSVPVENTASAASPDTGPASATQDPPVQTGGFSLAEPGARIIEYEVVPEPDIDISSLSMAEAGADVADPVDIDLPPPPDTGDMSMAEVGADVADPVNIDLPPPPDTGDMGLAEVGADVTDPVEQDFPSPPDTGDLSMADMGADVTDPVEPVPVPDIDTSSMELVTDE